MQELSLNTESSKGKGGEGSPIGVFSNNTLERPSIEQQKQSDSETDKNNELDETDQKLDSFRNMVWVDTPHEKIFKNTIPTELVKDEVQIKIEDNSFQSPETRNFENLDQVVGKV